MLINEALIYGNLLGHPRGEDGDAESLFEQKNVVAIGWEKMGDLSRFKTRDEFKKRYEQVYPGTKPGAIPVSAGQLFRFVHEMKVRDKVIFPLKRTAEIHLGRVTGEYTYTASISERAISPSPSAISSS